jgi:bifunctional NMN adenylyltransferase/nudix hydrolase
MKQALSIADHLLICIGSRNINRRSYRNPWNWRERKEMIASSLKLSGAVMHRVHITSIFDVPSDDEAWREQVHEAVERMHDKYIRDPFNTDEPDPKVTLIGYAKDESSYYLQLFPRFVYTQADIPKQLQSLNATDIRRSIYMGSTATWGEEVPEGAREYLQQWLRTNCLPDRHVMDLK